MSAPAKGALVALRSRRDEVIELLCDSYAADLLDVTEFERRLDLVHRATDLVVLNEIVRDVELADNTASMTSNATGTLPVAIEVSGRAKTKNVVAIMGGVRRKGQWRPPKKLRTIAIMGGVDLDFREVTLPPGPTDIHVYTIMGGVEIIVPPGVAVECEGIAIMGGFETVDRAPPVPDPTQATLRVRGFALMGGVDVSTRLPGESARQARRRRKREGKAKELAARKALTP